MKRFDVERLLDDEGGARWLVLATGVAPEPSEHGYVHPDDAIVMAIGAVRGEKRHEPIEATLEVVPGRYRVIEHDDQFGGSTRVHEKDVAVRRILDISDVQPAVVPEVEDGLTAAA